MTIRILIMGHSEWMIWNAFVTHWLKIHFFNGLFSCVPSAPLLMRSPGAALGQGDISSHFGLTQGTTRGKTWGCTRAPSSQAVVWFKQSQITGSTVSPSLVNRKQCWAWGDVFGHSQQWGLMQHSQSHGYLTWVTASQGFIPDVLKQLVSKSPLRGFIPWPARLQARPR